MTTTQPSVEPTFITLEGRNGTIGAWQYGDVSPMGFAVTRIDGQTRFGLTHMASGGSLAKVATLPKARRILKTIQKRWGTAAATDPLDLNRLTKQTAQPWVHEMGAFLQAEGGC